LWNGGGWSLNSVDGVGLSSGFVGHPSCCRDFVALFWWMMGDNRVFVFGRDELKK